MEKYTIDDLKSFERDERGYLICPTGDYTSISNFPSSCKFCAVSNFEKNTTFGDDSEFGNCCKFGDFTTFGALGLFGTGCKFSSKTKFNIDCKFGSRCNLEGHFFENLETPAVKVVKIDNIGSRRDCTYFF